MLGEELPATPSVVKASERSSQHLHYHLFPPLPFPHYHSHPPHHCPHPQPHPLILTFINLTNSGQASTLPATSRLRRRRKSGSLVSMGGFSPVTSVSVEPEKVFSSHKHKIDSRMHSGDETSTERGREERPAPPKQSEPDFYPLGKAPKGKPSAQASLPLGKKKVRAEFRFRTFVRILLKIRIFRRPAQSNHNLL